jgi:hypothetical protein
MQYPKEKGQTHKRRHWFALWLSFHYRICYYKKHLKHLCCKSNYHMITTTTAHVKIFSRQWVVQNDDVTLNCVVKKMSNSSMTSSICKANSQILLVHFPIWMKLFIYDFIMVTTVLYVFVVFNLLYLFSFSINNGSHDLYWCNKDALYHPEDDVIVIYANEYSKCTLFVCLFDGI